jgi:hypothetical protein
MREISLQEVVEVSGGANPAVLDMTGHDVIQYGTAILGAYEGWAFGSTYYPYAVVGLDVGRLALGTVGGAVGLAAGYFLGKLFTSQVHTRIGD